MANGAVFYKPIDASKLAVGSPMQPGANVASQQWVAGKTWAAGAICQNGGFLFSTAAGGAGAASGVGPTPQYLTDNACTWTLVGPVGSFNQSESAASMDLGTILLGKDFGPNAYGVGEFLYVKFTGATAIKAGDAVVIDRYNMTGTQSPAGGYAATKSYVVAISMASHALNVATPTYGWVMVRGVHDGANMLAAANNANQSASLSATAGAFSMGVANATVDAAVIRVVSTNGQGTLEIYWPTCAGR